MIRFDRVEQYRSQDPLGRKHGPGDDFGFFLIPSVYDRSELRVVANGEAEGWEHVSFSSPKRIPRWNEACQIKELFWDEDDFVIQFHPAKSEYVNLSKTCLHLWRYVGEFPTPPTGMVGPK